MTIEILGLVLGVMAQAIVRMVRSLLRTMYSKKRHVSIVVAMVNIDKFIFN